MPPVRAAASSAGDALAPGLAVAQAIGRLGNWFNPGLFGNRQRCRGRCRSTREPPGGLRAVRDVSPDVPVRALWCLGVAAVVWWLDRRYRMGHGRVFATYVALPTLGRLWWELLRIDSATLIFGSGSMSSPPCWSVLGAVLYIVISRRRVPGREESVYREPAQSVDARE